MRPFRFAGHPIHAIYAVCLIAELTNSSGNVHLFRQVAFVLPPTPIPFLVGLQIQRTLSFDLCPRRNTDSHLKINALKSIHQLMVNSHVWLPFKTVNNEVERGFDWDHLIKSAFRTHACDDTSSHDFFPVLCTNISPPATPTSTRIVPPWERDDWRSKLTEANLYHLHRVLRHSQATSMLNLFRQQRECLKVPRQIREYITHAVSMLSYPVYLTLPSRPCKSKHSRHSRCHAPLHQF